MHNDYYLTAQALIMLQSEDMKEYWEKRQQSYDKAPLSDLLTIIDIRRRMLRRNELLQPLERIHPDVPF